MSSKLATWDPREIKKNLSQRLMDAMEDRKEWEAKWQKSEKTVFNTSGEIAANNISVSVNENYSGISGIDQSSGTVGINYAFKNIRFIHSQLSANPPSIVVRPTSNDPDDRRKADAADRLIRFAVREYNMQEVVDRASLNCLLYGTGFTKTIWDAFAGDPLEFDEESGQYTMEGEFKVTVPNVWDVFVDPDATSPEDVRYVFEKIMISWEEAAFRFPDKLDILKKYRKQNAEEKNSSSYQAGSASLIKQPKYDVVELFEYWEKGLPVNGYIGRYCICTKEGDLITELKANPEIYHSIKKSSTGKKKPPVAVLPYQIFTDIDVPGNIYGKSIIEYVAQLQENLNRLDNVTLENVQAHGVARLILPEGAEIADGSITNSPWDVVKVTGNQGFTFAPPMQLPSAIPELMQRYKTGVDDMAGVNESMFGQQSRETSGFSMQYATNQGNLIRRRLFNKYVLFVEQIYKSYIRIIQHKWELPRMISALGKEKAFESVELKGADIDGGYDLVGEYGASLSLDPTTRREEMMTLMPLFEKAGIEPRQIMQMLKLNELSGLYDMLDMAKDRQQEIFQEMLSNGLYIAPEEMQDHNNMLQYCYYYLMSTEFKYLDDNDKALIRQHVKAREAFAAQGATPQGAPIMGTGNPPGPAPQGIIPPGAELAPQQSPVGLVNA